MLVKFKIILFALCFLGLEVFSQSKTDTASFNTEFLSLLESIKNGLGDLKIDSSKSSPLRLYMAQALDGTSMSSIDKWGDTSFIYSGFIVIGEYYRDRIDSILKNWNQRIENALKQYPVNFQRRTEVNEERFTTYIFQHQKLNIVLFAALTSFSNGPTPQKKWSVLLTIKNSLPKKR